MFPSLFPSFVGGSQSSPWMSTTKTMGDGNRTNPINQTKALLPASWFNWSQIGVNCCCEVTDRRQAGATYARFAAFASATRMITRLPSALAARVIVPSVTETFRGSSSLSNCERLV